MNSILNLFNCLNPSNLTKMNSKMSSKMNSKMAGINDLPIEIYELIFRDYLSIIDLFNCRLVNKKFKFATYRSVQKLMIGKFDKYRNEFWFHNDELINPYHVISLKCFKKIRSRSVFNLDQSLKYLKIIVNEDNYKEFIEEYSNLNNLINLECLEINKTSYIDLELDINLNNLNNLKYLNLFSQIGARELNTPKLVKIQFLVPSLIKLKSNPESIKHVITMDYYSGLKIFKNLEIIEFKDLCKFNENLDENLLSFNNLKQLKIESFCYKIESKDLAIKISNKSKELNRDIDIYLEGVNIMNEDKIKEQEPSKIDLDFPILDPFNFPVWFFM